MKFRFILFFVLIIFYSCEKKNENESKISTYSSIDSHNTGQNCMSCHRSGGEGEGWFTLAGSVYDTTQLNPYPNASIKLYTASNGSGTAVKLIEVDGLGNFYTTEAITFENGLYTSVINTEGVETFMSMVLPNGECNSCHGSSAVRIYTP